MLKGSTDTPKEATPNKMMETLEPPMLQRGEYVRGAKDYAKTNAQF